MKIKIINCRDNLLWYKDLIGLVFKVEKESLATYWCRELDEFRCLNIVLKEDAEIVADE